MDSIDVGKDSYQRDGDIHTIADRVRWRAWFAPAPASLPLAASTPLSMSTASAPVRTRHSVVFDGPPDGGVAYSQASSSAGTSATQPAIAVNERIPASTAAEKIRGVAVTELLPVDAAVVGIVVTTVAALLSNSAAQALTGAVEVRAMKKAGYRPETAAAITQLWLPLLTRW